MFYEGYNKSGYPSLTRADYQRFLDAIAGRLSHPQRPEVIIKGPIVEGSLANSGKIVRQLEPKEHSITNFFRRVLRQQ